MAVCLVGLSLGLTTCNPPLEGSLACPGGAQDCEPTSSDGSVRPKQPPAGPERIERAGPGSRTPFDPSADGSSGVKLDPGGNVVLDPGHFMGHNTPIIWVANSAEGTISKVDSRNMKEVARYVTFPGGGADPSRTSVSLDGDVVVANRARPDGHKASAVKIAGSKAACVDRNRNGRIDTFEGEGPVPPQFQWAAGQRESPDECVLWLTDLSEGATSTLPRAAGFDATVGDNGMLSAKVYIGLYNKRQLVRLNARTGAIEKRIDVSPVHPYGLVIDRDGNVWIVDIGGPMAKVDVRNGDRVTTLTGDKETPCPYGIAADPKGFIYTAGRNCIARLNPMTLTWERLNVPNASSLRGVAVDQNYGVWAADTNRGMVHVDASAATMVYKNLISVGGGNVGAAIDFDGFPWVISQGQSRAFKIHPGTYQVQSVAVGNGPYTYSDMTGFQLRNAAAPTGLFRQTFSGCGGNTQWVTLDFKVTAPSGTQVVVRVRAAQTRADLAAAPWTHLASIPPDMPSLPLPLRISGPQEYLQVEFALRSSDSQLTPILSSVSAGYNCPLG
ncbi:MAG: hypothetical protein RMK29_14970 [Myxococcales bacterium]|nr:hypothetical protein [Myxococcota bacterium]MDW8283016.1 hypothetical protein [Myxococcales bacterium]